MFKGVLKVFESEFCMDHFEMKGNQKTDELVKMCELNYETRSARMSIISQASCRKILITWLVNSTKLREMRGQIGGWREQGLMELE